MRAGFYRATLWLNVVLVTCWACASVPRLQGQSAETEAPGGAQFVFVIDDSGSMGQPEYGLTDPERLAVFAVRSLLGVLDDRSWATVVRLNGPSEGEDVIQLAPLEEAHRARLLEALSLNGPLARYAGEYTPCRSALGALKSMLEVSDRPGMSQVVIFLSDGKCTPAAQREDQVLDFPEGLRSTQGDVPRLQFYLLRFEGEEHSPQLAQLAEITGGSSIEVSRGDPTRILYTFAQALARSQGYEPLILSKSVRQLPAYQGARRIRLLAIARGDLGRALQVRVTKSDGKVVSTTGIEQGTHKFPGQKGYRFASVELQPVGQVAEVEVVGESDWEVVVLPEYHLSVELTLRRGRCDQRGGRLGGIAPAGSGLCAEIALVNAEGQSVGEDVTTARVQAVLRLQPSGDGEAQLIQASPNSSRPTSFQLDLQGLDVDHYELQGQVHLSTQAADEPRVLESVARTLQLVDMAIQAVPAELELDPVEPGKRSRKVLELHGNFSPSKASLMLEEEAELPECLALTFDGKELGAEVTIRPKQAYWLQVEASACERAASQSVDTSLRFEVEGLDPIIIPFRVQLENNAHRIEDVEVELPAGTYRGVDIQIPSQWGSFDMQTTSAENEQGEVYDRVRGEILSEPPIRLQPTEAGVGERVRGLSAEEVASLRVVASKCCQSGKYSLDVYLWPKVGSTVIVPLEVTVEGSWWRCYGSWVVSGVVGLLAGLLVFYILSMFSHSHWLDKSQLSARIVPLRWPRHGGSAQPARDRESDREEVEDMVLAELSKLRRARNWLRANPLVFGLPGREYRETVELFMTTDLESTSLSLVEERDVVERLRDSDELETWEEGRVFARAGRPVSFFVVRGSSKQVQQLTAEQWFGANETLSVEPVAKGQRFVRRLSVKDRKKGGVAGWVLE